MESDFHSVAKGEHGRKYKVLRKRLTLQDPIEQNVTCVEIAFPYFLLPQVGISNNKIHAQGFFVSWDNQSLRWVAD